MKISDNRCFECGTDENIVFHHVVPISLEGTRTVPLCEYHHGLVHSKKLTNMITLSLQKKKELIQKNFWPIGGNPPFGYTIVGKYTQKKLKINDEEGEIVSFIFKLTHELIQKRIYSKLKITTETLKELRERKYTYKGKPFKSYHLRVMLDNQFYIGVFTYSGEKYPHSFGNLVDKNVFEEIQVWRTGPFYPLRTIKHEFFQCI